MIDLPTDSDSMHFGEHRRSIPKRTLRPPFATADIFYLAPGIHLWNSGQPMSTQTQTFRMPNPQNSPALAGVPSSATASDPSSGHPGDVNFAFADGSVRFIKNTIRSWPLDPATSVPPVLRSIARLSVVPPMGRIGILRTP